MNLKKLELALQLAQKIVKKGGIRVAINPNFAFYHDRSYVNIFLHIDATNDIGIIQENNKNINEYFENCNNFDELIKTLEEKLNAP